MSEQKVKLSVGDYLLESIKGKVGTGDTTRDSAMNNFWVVLAVDEGHAVLELLDMNDQPSGFKEQVALKEMTGRFVPQPEFKPQTLAPTARQAERFSARGERHLAQKEYLSAEFEFNRALKLDEENVRANFGLGKTYVAQGEPEKAREVFGKLATVEAVMEPQHKHIFNEFGIELRKLGMYNEAVGHYQKALKLEAKDENLWFNLGRALCEGGWAAEGARALEHALKLNPALGEAKTYLDKVRAKQG